MSFRVFRGQRIIIFNCHGSFYKFIVLQVKSSLFLQNNFQTQIRQEITKDTKKIKLIFIFLSSRTLCPHCDFVLSIFFAASLRQVILKSCKNQ